MTQKQILDQIIDIIGIMNGDNTILSTGKLPTAIALQESLNYLRVLAKYSSLDREAFRRENEFLMTTIMELGG